MEIRGTDISEAFLVQDTDDGQVLVPLHVEQDDTTLRVNLTDGPPVPAGGTVTVWLTENMTPGMRPVLEGALESKAGYPRRSIPLRWRGSPIQW